MAATKKLYDIKLQVRVENGTTTSGAKALKSLNLNQIKLDATADQLLAAGEAVAHLQSQALSGIRVIDSYDLADGGEGVAGKAAHHPGGCFFACFLGGLVS